MTAYVLLIACCFILLVYGVWIFQMTYTWKKTNTIEDNVLSDVQGVSVLIPFRNESIVLETTLKNLSSQNYPEQYLEILFIDDHSTDDFHFVFKGIPVHVKCISNEGTGKKSAIETGIKYAKHELILTTDADCFHSPDWVSSMTSQMADANLLVGGVFLKKTKGLFNQILSLEFSSLQAVTGAMTLNNNPIVCNGANLMFRKSIFLQLEGYSGNENIASGDDVFLMEKIKRSFPNSIRYANSIDSIVYTELPTEFRSFINQRIRWASKSVHYHDLSTLYYGFLIAATNLLILLTTVNFFITNQVTFLFPIFAKLIVDAFLFYSMPSYLKSKNWFLYLPLSTLLYPIYSVGILLLSFFITPQWKGRKV